MVNKQFERSFSNPLRKAAAELVRTSLLVGGKEGRTTWFGGGTTKAQTVFVWLASYRGINSEEADHGFVVGTF